MCVQDCLYFIYIVCTIATCKNCYLCCDINIMIWVILFCWLWHLWFIFLVYLNVTARYTNIHHTPSSMNFSYKFCFLIYIVYNMSIADFLLYRFTLLESFSYLLEYFLNMTTKLWFLICFSIIDKDIFKVLSLVFL